MKKRNTILLMLMVVAVMFSCQKAENVFPDPEDELPFLDVREQVVYENEGSTQTVDVATNCADWSATADQSWVKLTPVQGTPGKLQIEVPENNIMDERSSVITIKANGEKLVSEIVVIQFGTTKKILFTGGARQTINGKATTFEVEIITNCPEIEWEMDAEAAWLSDVTTKTKAFEDVTKKIVLKAEQNLTGISREASVIVRGKGLGEGAMSRLVIAQNPDVILEKIPASLIEYTGFVGNDMANLFDDDFVSFGETGYQGNQGAESTILDVKVNAESLYKIEYYPRYYNPSETPIKLGNVNQYPADMELWVDKGSGFEKVQNVEIRGTGTQVDSKQYPNLVAEQIPYPVYDGAPLKGVRTVRFVIKSGNSKTTENNQFWNGSEIQFWGVPSTYIPPVKVPIVGATYSWNSGPEGDGADITKLYDGLLISADATSYWQSSYGEVAEDVLADGTTLTLDLDAVYPNFTGLRYYIRNNASQVPVKFDVYIDPGNGIYNMVKSFNLPTPWPEITASPNYKEIMLNSPVKAKSIKIHVKEAGGPTKMHFCASEIEAYIQPTE